MRGSLGLAAYRTVIGRRPAPPFAPVAARPTGELVWIHAAEPGADRASRDLAHRLVASRYGCTALLTCADGAPTHDPHPDVIETAAPPDHPATAEAFATHWAPDVAVWVWGGLRPNLVLAMAERDTHMILADAARDGFGGRRDRWLPEVPRHLLSKFDHVIARDQEAHLRLAQLGRKLDSIELAAPLQPFGQMLPAAESDLSDMTDALGGRPVWLATRVPADEVPTVIAAHRQALKTSHRLLLILHPRDDAAMQAVIAETETTGLSVADWSAGEVPDDTTQLFLAAADEDLGLWLRLAPVTFLGGTLSGKSDTMCEPYSAAAHGTALLHGPNIGAHARDLTRLTEAGAARIVNSTGTLGHAVGQTIAPDRAARMATAGWDVVTRGAESLDRIIDLVQAALDSDARGMR